MFEFITEEHRLIADSARRLFADLAATDTKIRQQGQGRLESAAVDRALSELGLFGSDDEDAAMQSAQVQALVAREAGTAALPFPVLETLAAHALVQCCQTAQPGMATVSSADRDATQLPVLADGRLQGVVGLVPFIEYAELVVFAARRADDIVLVQLTANDAGIRRRKRATVEDDYPVHDLYLESATPVAVMEVLNDGRSAVEFLRRRTSLLAAAEIAGAGRKMVAMAQEHLLARSQFGQVLGANQALKHALADCHVKIEALVTTIDYAAAADDAGAADAEACIAAAKHFAGRAGKAVADTVFQLHGAIGYTMEFPLHLMMRRAHRLGACYGATRNQGTRLFEIFLESV